MKLPSATTTSLPSATVALEKPPVLEIDLYERVDNSVGYRFFAISYPLGGRPCKAFGDTKKQVMDQVKSLLRAGKG